MSADPIPADVRRFLVEHIDSVPALEALLLMRGSPGRRWTVTMLAGELYMRPQEVRPILVELSARGLCGSGGGDEPVYWWQPSTPARAALVFASDPSEADPARDLFRVVAYGMIVVAIVDKNVRRR